MEISKSLVGKSELQELRMGRTSFDVHNLYYDPYVSEDTLSAHQAGVSLLAPNVVTELIN